MYEPDHLPPIPIPPGSFEWRNLKMEGHIGPCRRLLLICEDGTGYDLGIGEIQCGKLMDEDEKVLEEGIDVFILDGLWAPWFHLSRGLQYPLQEYRKVDVRVQREVYNDKAFFMRSLKKSVINANLTMKGNRACLQLDGQSTSIVLEANSGMPSGRRLRTTTTGDIRLAFSLGRADEQGIFTLVGDDAECTVPDDTVRIPPFGFRILTSADVPSADVPSADVASADVASADVPSADVASADVPSADVASADVPSADVPSADVASADVTSADVASADVASADVASADVPRLVNVRMKTLCTVKCVMLPIQVGRRGEIVEDKGETFTIRFANREEHIPGNRVRKGAAVGEFGDCWVDDRQHKYTEWPNILENRQRFRTQVADNTADFRVWYRNESENPMQDIEATLFLQTQDTAHHQIGCFDYHWLQRGHPNIMPALFVASAPQLVLMGTPSLNGDDMGDLLDAVSKGERYPQSETWECIKQVSSALEFAHGFGLANFNISAQNIATHLDGCRRIYILRDWHQSLLHQEVEHWRGQYCPLDMKWIRRDGRGVQNRSPEQYFTAGVWPNYLYILPPHFGFNVDAWQLGMLLHDMIAWGFPDKKWGFIREANTEKWLKFLCDPKVHETRTVTFGDVEKQWRWLEKEATPGEKDMCSRLVVLDPMARPGMISVRQHWWITGPKPPLYFTWGTYLTQGIRQEQTAPTTQLPAPVQAADTIFRM